MVTDGEMTRAGVLCLTCSGPSPICCHGDRQASLPLVCGVAVGHTVTQQPSWSSSQTLASWLRASLGPGYLPECCPSSRVQKLPIGTAELCPGFPVLSGVCETLGRGVAKKEYRMSPEKQPGPLSPGQARGLGPWQEKEGK